ncbi:MAG: hypothetical protein LKF37_10930 [Lentilactobacillus diolivorans]|nr:hypothetical protein [Lentilactobacillus diolivorans]
MLIKKVIYKLLLRQSLIEVTTGNAPITAMKYVCLINGSWYFTESQLFYDN